MNSNRHSVWSGLATRLVTIALTLVATVGSAAWKRTPANETTEPYRTWQMPGTNIASPSGYGANWGNFYFGGAYQASAGTSTSTGSLGLGFGLGNSQRIVGLDVSMSLLDISSFKNGIMNAKLHRALPAGFGVAVGAESFLGFGDTIVNPAKPTETGTGIDPRAKSFYGSVSKIFFMREETQWFSALTLTGGVGNGRFRSSTDYASDVSGVNVFGSAAIRVKQPVALIVDWGGSSLSVGASITPIRTLGLFINPSLTNVNNTARFVLGAGLAMSFI